MKRRSFLRHAFHAAAVPGVFSSLGFTMPGKRSMEYFLRLAAESDRVLVMVYLDGGNDGLNTVVPLNYMSELNSVRPRVVLDENDILPLAQSEVGFHPALSGLKDLYSENRLQIIQNVGYDNPNFSHFRSTDIWVSGSDADQIIDTGWMGRHLETQYPEYPESYPTNDMQDPLAVEMGYGSSLLFQGSNALTSFTLRNADSFYQLLDNVEQEAPDTPAGEKLKFVRLIAQQSQQYGERIVNLASSINQHQYYPSTELAQQLKIVSKLIAAGSRTPVYLVRLGGFDTHEGQVEADHSRGQHTYLLETLNDAIVAFMNDLEFHNIGNKVLGMTFSEFGRTILSNASNGTDHGTAAPMFFFGNKVRGGVTGSNPVIDRSMNYYDNLPHEFDFRQMYNSVLDQWFGVEQDTRNSVLLGSFDTVEIIGDPAITLSAREEHKLTVYPNPVQDMATVSFTGDGSPVDVNLMDLQGRVVSSIFRGNSQNGRNDFSWNASQLKNGRYFVVLNTKSGKEIFSVIK